ncbi:MAG: DNA adenine methylase [Planctomycetota bacterium]|nr:DNA adenine methylase [Planctomycetota bacterium]
MIKYLGSKRVLIPSLVEWIEALDGVTAVADLFAGTSRVGHALKSRGYRVLANDHNAYAHTLATCYVQADHEVHAADAERHLAELRQLPGAPGYFTRTFCQEARFFRPENGARVDAIRAELARRAAAGELGDDPARAAELEAILLVSLMEAADRVDSTTGVQMAYLKSWAPRAARELELRLPALLPAAPHGKSLALGLDAVQAARLAADEVDLAYLDPPYNQHKYLGNYHIWETLVRNDEPEAYGVARKRIDCRERKSPFNSKGGIAPALAEVIEAALSGERLRYLLVSFSDEGFLDRATIEAMLDPHGEVEVISRDHPRYVGARIGIHNPAGERVGTVGKLRNKELLFLLRRS